MNAELRARIVAINIAREGMEGLRNMRDTNWMKFSGDRRGRWNARCEVESSKMSSDQLVCDDETDEKIKIKHHYCYTIDMNTSSELYALWLLDNEYVFEPPDGTETAEVEKRAHSKTMWGASGVSRKLYLEPGKNLYTHKRYNDGALYYKKDSVQDDVPEEMSVCDCNTDSSCSDGKALTETSSDASVDACYAAEGEKYAIYKINSEENKSSIFRRELCFEYLKNDASRISDAEKGYFIDSDSNLPIMIAADNNSVDENYRGIIHDNILRVVVAVDWDHYIPGGKPVKLVAELTDFLGRSSEEE